VAKNTDKTADATDTLLDDLLSMDVAELNASGPTPAEDPLSLVRDAEEPEQQPAGIPENSPTTFKEGERVTFHVVRDDIYVLNRLYRRGDTITLTVGRGAWHRTLGFDGRSWVEDIPDPEAQIRLFGRVSFAMGEAEDPRMAGVEVPDFIEGDEQIKAWKASVLKALDQITRNR
jgi:hypothetical protein